MMHVFIIAATTIDGFIARETGQTSTDWTSKEDTQWFRQRTKDAGVVVMGSKTYQTVGRPMPNRLNVIMTRNPEQFAADSEAHPSELMFTNLSPIDLLKQLEAKGYSEVAICGGSSIYSEFMKQGLINTIYLTIEPVVFGEGVSLFNQKLDNQLRLVKTTPLSDQTLLMEYAVA